MEGALRACLWLILSLHDERKLVFKMK